MTTFLKIVAAVAKYGKKLVNWCWDNKKTILKWIERGVSASWIIEYVKDLFGF